MLRLLLSYGADLQAVDGNVSRADCCTTVSCCILCKNVDLSPVYYLLVMLVCCVCTLGARLTCDRSYTGSNCFAVACGSEVRVEMLRHHEPLKMFYVTVRARKNGESVSLLLAHSAASDKQVHIIV